MDNVVQKTLKASSCNENLMCASSNRHNIATTRVSATRSLRRGTNRRKPCDASRKKK